MRMADGSQAQYPKPQAVAQRRQAAGHGRLADHHQFGAWAGLGSR